MAILHITYLREQPEKGAEDNGLDGKARWRINPIVCHGKCFCFASKLQDRKPLHVLV
jgi:hypothetical protein